jgi:hypothetical protein
MKVSNITNNRGNKAPNQLLIIEGNKETFQSYDSTIAVNDGGTITLDPMFWDYSVTTLKFLKIFLNTEDSKKQIQAKIDSGEYLTADLN